MALKTEPKKKAKTIAGVYTTGMISFSRSLQISEGLMFGANLEGGPPVPLEVVEKGVRGQTSQAKTEAGKAGASNPQSVDFACIPPGCDSLMIHFGLRVLANSREPHGCDSPAVASAYRELATEYASRGGYDTLALRYVGAIACGRFAWRNRLQSDEARVRVAFGEQEVVFNPLMLRLDTVPTIDDLELALLAGSRMDLDLLVMEFGVALANPRRPLTAEITWIAKMAPGSEVFPSQEYLRGEKSKDDEKVSRVLASISTTAGGRRIRQASMHSQKIGAALRHIDDWYEGAASAGRVISVNPYGGVQETGDVMRPPKSGKSSFYDLRDDDEGLMSSMTASPIAPDAHFFIANLVRGGVFGGNYEVSGGAGAAGTDE